MPRLKCFFPNNTRGIELTAVGSWLFLALYLFVYGEVCLDVLCVELVQTIHRSVWVVGLIILAMVHALLIFTTPALGYRGRMICSLIGVFLASYITTLGLIMAPNMAVALLASLIPGLSWTVIRHGFIK